MISELHVQKSINQEQKERIMKLSEEIETARRNITNNVSQIKLMQAKIDELRRLDSVSQIANIDLLNLRDLSVVLKKIICQTHSYIIWIMIV